MQVWSVLLQLRHVRLHEFSNHWKIILFQRWQTVFGIVWFSSSFDLFRDIG